MTTRFARLAEEVLAGRVVGAEEAMAMVRSSDDDLLGLLDGAYHLRRTHFGRGVTLHVIHSARSGRCGEDCAYCSQSAAYRADIAAYPIQSAEDIVAGAWAALYRKASRYCIVTSGGRPSTGDLDVVCDAVRRIHDMMPLAVCTSLGSLDPVQAKQLASAGVQRYNHNIETVPRVFRQICTTHTFEDRLNTARVAKAAGMELCSGVLLGIGETPGERVDAALMLREIGADAIPVNFLDPRPGTPLGEARWLQPSEALRTLAMFRFIHPSREIRVAGGRERILGPMQAMALYVANSIFTDGYLTTEGQGFEADLAMIEKAGFDLAGIAE